MKPELSLSEEQIARHNELYAGANELTKGLIILDGVPHSRPGFFAKRRLRKAVKLYQQVLEINPASWQSMFCIAKALQSLEELQESLAWFVRAYGCEPGNPSLAKETGYAASRLGRHDIALKAMEPAVKQHPSDPALQCNFGLTCLLAGKAADACAAFEQTVKLEPQNDVNKKLLRFAQEVASGGRGNPKTEQEIIKAIERL
ncbi:MAG TPA: tetratricopeptide repeat protein [Candidatus Acidoferrales bacterium]|nr:tetratricopeptide repeat protein [Candidatus Acidoferrales bacterium]